MIYIIYGTVGILLGLILATIVIVALGFFLPLTAGKIAVTYFIFCVNFLLISLLAALLSR